MAGLAPVMFHWNDDLLTTAGTCVATGNLIPVDHVPPGIEVLGTAVLVLEIVGVFPDIIAHDREQSIRQRAVLVSRGHNREFAALVKDQPCPARTKAFNARIIEGGLELVERAKGLLNGAGQFACRLAAA